MHSFNNITRLLLASGSPRRQQLIKYMGLPVELVRANADESCDIADPALFARELAIRKASAALEVRQPEPGEVIVSADTSVWVDGEMLGKPASEADAHRMLRKLSGRSHQVYTGTALAYLTKDGSGKISCRIDAFAVCTDVNFNELTDEEIWDYIATGEPMDKAGAYGIQDAFSIHIDSIKGDYNNVVGLPVAALYTALKAADSAICPSAS